jgi:fructose-1,6-bisphosphatase/inositol monophosphatase family enzyme
VRIGRFLDVGEWGRAPSAEIYRAVPHRTTEMATGDPRHDLLRALLERAGEVALRSFRAPVVQRKADGSPVTNADLEAEVVLIEGLRAAFPDDAICSEESPPSGPPDAPGTWYVDPIDGTSALTDGLAHWGPTVARRDARGWDVGAFWVPRLREWWFASRGRGAWRDGQRLPSTPVARSGASKTLYLPSGAHHLGALTWRGKSRGLGSTAAHLALVAGGASSVTVVPTWSPWDVGCGLLLLEETGRAVTDLDGAPVDPMATEPAAFLAGPAPLLTELAQALRHALELSPSIRRPHV